VPLQADAAFLEVLRCLAAKAKGSSSAHGEWMWALRNLVDSYRFSVYLGTVTWKQADIRR